MLVDNTPPSIEGLKVNGRRVQATLLDGVGPIQRIEIAVSAAPTSGFRFSPPTASSTSSARSSTPTSRRSLPRRRRCSAFACTTRRTTRSCATWRSSSATATRLSDPRLGAARRVLAAGRCYAFDVTWNRHSGGQVALPIMALRRWFLLSSVLLGAALVDACSSSDDAIGSQPMVASAAYCNSDSGSDAAPDHTLEVGTLDQQPPGDGSSYNPLCGQGCDPDDLRACSDSAAPSPAGPDGRAMRGWTPLLLMPRTPSRPEAGPSDSGVRRDVEATRYGCQVRRNGSGRAAICGPAGSGNRECALHFECGLRSRLGLYWRRQGRALPAVIVAMEAREVTDPTVIPRLRLAQTETTAPCDRCATTPTAPIRCRCRCASRQKSVCSPTRIPARRIECAPAPRARACTVVRNDGTTGCVAPGDRRSRRSVPLRRGPPVFCRGPTGA